LKSRNAISADPNVLIPTRFFDIALGSVTGAIAGWFIHHEQLKEKQNDSFVKPGWP
jgi:hypothetical protein